MSSYFIDLDGTIVQKLSIDDLERLYGTEIIQDLLPGVSTFFKNLSEENIIIFTTARIEKYSDFTKRTLEFHNIKYHSILFGLTTGKRFLINDTPNVTYQKAIAINVLSDTGFGDTLIFDSEF